MRSMNKKILIRIPAELYNETKRFCARNYKSVSALLRELLIEELNDELTPEEIDIVKTQSRLFRKGKGVNWRKVKRG